VQVFVSTSKAICKGFQYQYFDRTNKIQVALDEPLLVPAGLLNLDTFGFPFPDIPCFRALATRKNNDEPTRKGRWLYLHELPLPKDVGREMAQPLPEDLPPKGSGLNPATPKGRPADHDSEDENWESDDLPVMKKVCGICRLSYATTTNASLFQSRVR
jgi:hypothetical protein